MRLHIMRTHTLQCASRFAQTILQYARNLSIDQGLNMTIGFVLPIKMIEAGIESASYRKAD